MCGIIGFVSSNNTSEKFNLASAIARLRHRGPDDSGQWHDDTYPNIGLGFVRLSIIDLSSAGHQPMESPCGRYVIVFNGEIYNFSELRAGLEQKGESFIGHSDTEVLLQLFIHKGLEGCLAKLRGMFAFSIWDRNTRTLFCARDRLGVKPFVYAETNNGFLFSSEIQGILALDPTLSRKPDLNAIDHYLTFQYIPSPLSGFESIRKLPPAHAMVIKDGSVKKIFRYWNIDFSKRSRLSFKDASEVLREKILEATKIRMVSDVPLGAFLSGGIDSSITVAAMAHLSGQPIKTYSIGFNDERFNELPYARQAAEHLGTDHHEMIVEPDAVKWLPKLIDHLGEPMADNSILPTFYVSQFAREGVTVSLTGDGGDESFAGYRRTYQMRRVEALDRAGLTPLWRGLRKLTIAVEDQFKPHRPNRTFPASRSDEMLLMEGAAAYKHRFSLYSDRDKEELLTEDFKRGRGRSQTTAYLQQALNHASDADITSRWCYTDLVTSLPEQILYKVDIASMAASLECRSPFLDQEVVEFAYSLPGRYKLSLGGKHKHILREAFSDWLPQGFLDHPKMGFSVPLSRWLKEDFGPLLHERLVEKEVLSPWFHQATIKRYVEEHLSGRKAHTRRLWPLLILTIWLERFDVEVST